MFFLTATRCLFVIFVCSVLSSLSLFVCSLATVLFEAAVVLACHGASLGCVFSFFSERQSAQFVLCFLYRSLSMVSW